MATRPWRLGCRLRSRSAPLRGFPDQFPSFPIVGPAPDACTEKAAPAALSLYRCACREGRREPRKPPGPTGARNERGSAALLLLGVELLDELLGVLVEGVAAAAAADVV